MPFLAVNLFSNSKHNLPISPTHNCNKQHANSKIAPAADVELGLLPPTNTSQLSVNTTSEQPGDHEELEDRRHRMHQIIGDTLELFSKHLRA